MALREVPLKPTYDSDEDDVLNSFYIPALSGATRYDRLAGFFSSTALAVAARGMSGLVKNGGRMRLVAGARLSKDDVEALRQGIEQPEEAVARLGLKDLNGLETEFVRAHVRALGWMVAKGHLDIRLAILTDQEGLPLSEDLIHQRGIFHQKVGVFSDESDDVVSFSGSVNESATAWTENIEEFKVFRSWIEAEREHLRSDENKFQKYWFGRASHCKTIDVPQALREKLIAIAPDDFAELQLLPKRHYGTVRLRAYQDAAVHNWLSHDARGIMEMATGTGKTFAALAGAVELRKRCGRLAIVISSPFIHLVDQWASNLNGFSLQGIKAYGSASAWEDELADEILDYNNGIQDTLVVITTHDTLSSPRFMNLVEGITGNLLLIADEVHGLGSLERRKGLLPQYSHRLGLSATPRRWLDDEGTSVLLEYFGDTVFEFPLKAAIPEFLAPYEYYPHFVELTPDELEEYRKMTRKIAAQYSNADDEKQTLFDLYCILRQKIVTDARSKMGGFMELIAAQKTLDHWLVYCSPNQIDMVQDFLSDRGIVHHRFTARESAKERQKLLKAFAAGRYQVLVAMNCLDEGVDVPATKTAAFLASSGNPKQFIQRRGRILRKAPGKEKAIIHDFIVIPGLSREPEPEFAELERRILRKELRRYEEFASASLNSAQALNLIFPIIQRYKVI